MVKLNFILKFLILVLCVCPFSAAWAQLSGSYTVDPTSSSAKNYTTLGAAFSALSSQGVSGPVSFSIVDGSYTGLQKADSVPGASSINTITFQGDTSDSSKVVLTNAQDAITLHLEDARHFVFKHLTIENTYKSTYYNLFITHSDSNRFESCHFIANDEGRFGYNAYLNDAEYNAFEHCKFEGGYNNVYLFGAGVNNKSRGNSFSQCVLEKQYFNGFSQYYCSHTSFVNSSIDSFVNGRNGYAFDAYSSNAITLDRSRIWGSGTTLYLSFCNFYSSSSADTNVITNNMIGGGYYATLYSYQSNRCNFLNNSIEHSDGAAAARGVHVHHALGHRWLNNNIRSLAGAYGLYLYAPNGFKPEAFDHNNLWLSGNTQWAYFLTQNAGSLNRLKNLSSDFNQKSLSVPPGFTSDKNLSSLEPRLNGAGTYVGLKKDIDGNSRPHGNDKNFDIGCTEFWLPSQDIDLVAILNPVRIIPENTVTVALRNRGQDTIVQAIYSLSYSSDSGKQFFVSEHDTIRQLAPGAVHNYSFQTKWKPLRNGDFRLVVRMDQNIPGDPDTRDSIAVDICTGLSGTYTIDPSKPSGSFNFQSLGEAVAKLKCGLEGPTTFLMAPGTYNEAIEIPRISGASSGARLTIDGKHPDSVLIVHQGRSFEKAYTIQLNGASYVDLKNLTLISKSGAFGQTVRLCNGASNNLIERCKITGENSSNSNSAGIAIQSNLSADAGTDGSHNIVRNNVINGHYFGVRILGRSGRLDKTQLNALEENIITNYYQAGLSLTYADSSFITNNRIVKPRYSSGSGIHEYYCKATRIVSNEIVDFGQFGIHTHYSNFGFPYSSSLMRNNLVGGESKLTSNFKASAAIDIYHNSSNWVIRNNSVLLKSTNTPGYYSTSESIPAAVRFMHSTGADVRNNVFCNDSRSNKSVAFLNSYSTFSVLDYNQYFSVQNQILAHDGFAIKTLSTWQTVRPDWNDNAIALRPHFVSDKNLRLQKSKESPRGLNLGLMEDIDGRTRCTIAPSLGAAESTHPTTKPNAFFASADTLFEGTPYLIYNGASPYAKEQHEWWVGGVKEQEQHHLHYTFSSRGLSEIRLISSNCGGTDTFSKWVFIDTVSAKPVADFASDKNLVSIDEEVKFTDLSTNGPNDFSWRLSPYTYFDPSVGFDVRTYDFVNGTDSTSRYPEIAFFYPGRYDVCLTLSNKKGTHSICKDEYITVKDQHIMCQTGSGSEELQGNLFDPGGASGNYGAGAYYSCSFLINPCAKELDLKFNHFDLAPGDVLKIYDGTSSQDPPLHAYASAYSNGLTGNLLANYFRDTLKALSGKAYIEFQTSNPQGATGFDLTWTGKKGSGLPPVASFTMPDSVCRRVPFVAVAQASGRNHKYYWSMNGKAVDYTDSIVNHSYEVTGSYWVKLTVENCYGQASDSQKIEVVRPRKAPTADFSTPNLRVKKGHPVTFDDLSTYNGFSCSNSWLWRFSSPLVSFAQGTDSLSENPVVVFEDTGCFDVELIVANAAGKDSIERKCYVQVIDYCDPSVAFLNGDLGISRVVLNEIDNRSAMGESAYTDYSQDHSTTLQIGASYTLEVHRSGNLINSQNGAVWIDFNQDGVFTDSTELVASSPSARQVLTRYPIKIPNGAKLGLSTMRVAVNINTRKNLSCGPNQFGEFEDYGVYISPDTEAPSLFINYYGNVHSADTTILIEQCATWNNPTGFGVDNVDGVLSLDSIEGEVNMTKPGTYRLEYLATDKTKNQGVGILTVQVQRDTTDPVMVLKGLSLDTIDVFASYSDPGVEVFDNCDTSLKASVLGSVNSSELGTYAIRYSVSDKSFNTVSLERRVEVVDRVSPMLSFTAPDTSYINVFDAFNGLAVTVTDNYYTAEGIELEVLGTVDPNTVGIYTLSYQAKDGSGNLSNIVEKYVAVEDKEFPTVKLKGLDTVEVDVNTVYLDAGISASDNYTQLKDLNIENFGSFFDFFGEGDEADSIGIFEYGYRIKDQSGNTVEVSRWVEVVDREAPVAVINGAPVVEVSRWSEYVDAGVSVSDNYWDDQDITVHITTNVNTQALGVYHVTYCPKDLSGNAGACVYRVVQVVAPVSVNQGAEAVLSAYPVPADNYVVVSLQGVQEGNFSYQVVNSLGQEVLKGAELISSGKSELQLTTQNLKSGIYYATLQGADESYFVKFVVQH